MADKAIIAKIEEFLSDLNHSIGSDHDYIDALDEVIDRATSARDAKQEELDAEGEDDLSGETSDGSV